jgi:hypothetical protein
MDEGPEEYQLHTKVWEAIGEAMGASGNTIPAIFGIRLPNLEKDMSNAIAETWMVFALYVGPVLLRGRFIRDKYYDHFIKLVRLIKLCLQYEISSDDVEKIRAGFIEWVEDYEK